MEKEKWVQVAEYRRFNLWLNTECGYKECFRKGVNPNTIKQNEDVEENFG